MPLDIGSKGGPTRMPRRSLGEGGSLRRLSRTSAAGTRRSTLNPNTAQVFLFEFVILCHLSNPLKLALMGQRPGYTNLNYAEP